ncbi:POK9 protein, partial [Ciccaba nigrolineata]|nr:POK9 protein [Ciccaba nigrolineata]
PYGALLVGRSSSGLKGLFILSGVVDKDYVGEIQIILQTFFPPVYVPKGSRIARLVPLQQITDDRHPVSPERGSGGFGSTGGLALLTVPLNKRPEITITVIHEGEQKIFSALLDTGADITIIS